MLRRRVLPRPKAAPQQVLERAVLVVERQRAVQQPAARLRVVQRPAQRRSARRAELALAQR